MTFVNQDNGDVVLSITRNELAILRRLAEVIIWAQEKDPDMNNLPSPPTDEEYSKLVDFSKRIINI